MERKYRDDVELVADGQRQATRWAAAPAPSLQRIHRQFASAGGRTRRYRCASSHTIKWKQLGSKHRKPDIGAERIVKPSADIVAGRPAPVNDFVVAAAPTEIAGPAG